MYEVMKQKFPLFIRRKVDEIDAKILTQYQSSYRVQYSIIQLIGPQLYIFDVQANIKTSIELELTVFSHPSNWSPENLFL